MQAAQPGIEVAQAGRQAGNAAAMRLGLRGRFDRERQGAFESDGAALIGAAGRQVE